MRCGHTHSTRCHVIHFRRTDQESFLQGGRPDLVKANVACETRFRRAAERPVPSPLPLHLTAQVPRSHYSTLQHPFCACLLEFRTQFQIAR
jgi:hypothetical protein